MKKFDLTIFLNKFYYNKKQYFFIKKLVSICLKVIYGVNMYSASEICILFGFNKYLTLQKLDINTLTYLFFYFKINFNFFLYDFKINNVKVIKTIKNRKGWRHIFNLPVRGQRSHTNAKTRKKYNIY